MVARRFTVAEANALIPRLEMLMERLQRTALVMRSALHDGEPTAQLRTTAGVLRVRPELAPYVRELESTVGEIEQLGCQFKGLDLGLVDFPAEIGGTLAFLCWQYGEREIAYWHGLDEGFAARRALAAVATPQLQ